MESACMCICQCKDVLAFVSIQSQPILGCMCAHMYVRIYRCVCVTYTDSYLAVLRALTTSLASGISMYLLLTSAPLATV